MNVFCEVKMGTMELGGFELALNNGVGFQIEKKGMWEWGMVKNAYVLCKGQEVIYVRFSGESMVDNAEKRDQKN